MQLASYLLHSACSKLKKQLPKNHQFKLVGTICILGSTLGLGYTYGESKDTSIDLLPVELGEQPIELGQAAPSNSNTSTPSTTSSPTIPNIVTSRPSFTDAEITVPQGSFQAESGATYTDNRGGTYLWGLPETLLRFGMTDNTEFRFTPPNYIYLGNKHPGSLINNFGDMSVGLSHHLIAPGKVDVALIPILNIPSGANSASSNSLGPQFRVVLGKNLTNKWIMSGQLDTRWNTRPNRIAAVVFNPTFINYYSFTKKFTGFLEYSGFYPTHGKTLQFIQSGALYLLTPRQQLDARIAVGLNKTSPKFLVGFGYSFRIDGLFGTSKAFSSFHR
jgi:hypothetical protein